jgi:CheY-like chemotaxis protein
VTRANSIMLVEDDGDISDAIASCLEDHGYRVMLAANGQEALEKLRGAPVQPDLILLDLMMPVMDGWQFRAAQKADPTIASVPVVLLSAHVNVREAAAKLSAAGWLKKPIDLDSLLEAVEKSYS